MPIEIIRYAEKNLEPGEKILFQTRTHWIVLVKPGILLLFGLAIAIATQQANLPTLDRIQEAPFEALWQTPYILFLPIAAVFILQGGVMLIARALVLIGSEMTVTTRRVIDKEGLIWRSANELAGQKLEGSQLSHQSWLGQILDYGTLSIDGTGGKTLTLPYAKAPITLRHHVSRLIAHFDRRRRREKS